MPDESIVNVPASALASLQGRLSQLEAQQAAAAKAQQEANDNALIAAGRGHEVTARKQQELAAEERRLQNFIADNALKGALVDQPLAGPEAADQIAALLRHELVIDPGGTVRTKDFRPVKDLVKERLAQPAFSHFLAAANPQPGALVAPAEPRNFGEQLLQALPNFLTPGPAPAPGRPAANMDMGQKFNFGRGSR